MTLVEQELNLNALLGRVVRNWGVHFRILLTIFTNLMKVVITPSQKNIM